MAHDLRSPAYGLQGTGKKLKYLIESQQLDRLQEFGDTVDYSVSALNNLLDNLLKWTHQNLKTTSLRPELLSIDHLVQTILEASRAEIQKKQQTVHLDIPAGLQA